MKPVNFKNMLQVKQQKGVVLLEALIAILIFSFGILAIAGLQGAMVKNTTESGYRAEASYLAQQQLGLMWADPNNLAYYVTNPPNISARLPSGAMVIAQPVTDKIQITVTWQVPGQNPHNYVANGYVMRGCPACT